MAYKMSLCLSNNNGGNLDSLYLDYNRISSIEVYTFNSLKSLSRLSLASNQIVSIPTSVFLGLINLKEVYLSNNPIFDIYGQLYLQSLCDPNPFCKVY